MFKNKQIIFLPLAVSLGIGLGLTKNPIVFQTADIISEIFIRILKTISLPIISLSLIATLSGLEKDMSLKLGRKVLQYTIFTTVIAAVLSWFLYDLAQPVQQL